MAKFAHMHTSPAQPALIGSAEAAQILGVSRATFNRWVAAGRIETAVEMPGSTGARLFTVDEVERVKAEGVAA